MLTCICRFGSQEPAPPPNKSTKKAAISLQYAKMSAERQSTAVAMMTQNRLRYREVDESEIAPKVR